ncbi:WAT1-related protein At3g28050 [Linum perenne]
MTEGYVYRDVLPFSAMVIMQSVAVGLNTLFKAATMEGMSYHVFVAYIHAIGALVLLLPAHFFSYRSRVVPPLSFHVVCKIGFLGMIGSSSQIMGYTGINYSSPTLDSAISNITPAFTFILAVAFSKTSQNWVLGGFFLTCQYILVPLWYIVQTQIMKEYPDELTVVFLYDLVVSIVAAVVALITEGTSPTAWILGPNIALASVFCSGILGSCLNIIVHTWALRIKGPVFVAMFRPLSIVIALVMGVVFLGDTLHLGSLVGAAVISIGFYTMMWGKAQEEQDLEE